MELIVLTKIVIENCMVGQQVKILTWSKARFDGIQQEIVQVGRNRLFGGKWTTGKSDAFKSEIGRIWGQHVMVH